MSAVSIQKKEYKGWKNCIEISNGIIDLIATTDIGPRIIRFGFAGKENEFYEIESESGLTGSDKFVFYGGHRLWHSPEDPIRTNIPDNGKVKWKKKKNGIALDQTVEPWSLIKKDMEISMSPDKAEVTVLHKITNQGAWAIEVAAWGISMMAPGGTEFIPQIERDAGFLPNRSVVLWSYTKMNDPRFIWGDKYITMKQDPKAEGPIKIGIPNEDEWAAYANHGHLFIKKYSHFMDEVYPDFGSSYESYTNGAMLEMETLSPLVLLEPGDTIEHTEVWTLHDGIKVPANEKEVNQIILPLVK